jgi:hypothetical protein
MVAGAEASGAFKAKGIVVKFEHKEPLFNMVSFSFGSLAVWCCDAVILWLCSALALRCRGVGAALFMRCCANCRAAFAAFVVRCAKCMKLS